MSLTWQEYTEAYPVTIVDKMPDCYDHKMKIGDTIFSYTNTLEGDAHIALVKKCDCEEEDEFYMGGSRDFVRFQDTIYAIGRK